MSTTDWGLGDNKKAMNKLMNKMDTLDSVPYIFKCMLEICM